jgi:hypothetical protein
LNCPENIWAMPNQQNRFRRFSWFHFCLGFGFLGGLGVLGGSHLFFLRVPGVLCGKMLFLLNVRVTT